MKKITLYAMLLLVSLSSISSPLFATEKNPREVVSNTREVPTDVTKLVTRLETIKAMDKSKLNRSEKKCCVKKYAPLNQN